MLPENWEAVEVFQYCCRNWIFKGIGGEREGLDVTAIVSVLSLYELPPAGKRKRLNQVQLIELGALNVMNQPRN